MMMIEEVGIYASCPIFLPHDYFIIWSVYGQDMVDLGTP